MSDHALNVCGIEIPWETRTLEGFRSWVATLGERGPRVSFADGRLHVEVSPQSYHTHEPLAAAINATLQHLADELDVGRYFMPPSWFTHEPTALSTEPDGFFASWQTLQSGRLTVNPKRPVEMLGRPDMTLEIVSDTSERKDMVEHVHNYAAAGVREYWIADARADDLVFRILELQLDGTYADAEPDEGGWLASPLWGLSFRIRRHVDRAGLPKCTLDLW